MYKLPEHGILGLNQRSIVAISAVAAGLLLFGPFLKSWLGDTSLVLILGGALSLLPIIIGAMVWDARRGALVAAVYSALTLLSIGVESMSLIAAEIIGFFLAAVLTPVVVSFKEETNTPSKDAVIDQVRDENAGAMERVARTVGKDLRQPLSSILSAVRKLEENVDPEQQDTVNLLSRELERLQGVAEDYLNFAAPKVTHTQHVSVPSIVEKIVDQMKPHAKRLGVRLVFNSEEIDGFTCGDEDRLGKLFLNLLINGLQAAEGGGQVEVDCKLSRSGGTLDVEISDTGSGIKDEIMNRIFEPFFSTRLRGSGLGLSIAKAIAREHGGRITATNLPSSGVRFVVSLPHDTKRIVE